MEEEQKAAEGDGDQEAKTEELNIDGSVNGEDGNPTEDEAYSGGSTQPYASSPDPENEPGWRGVGAIEAASEGCESVQELLTETHFPWLDDFHPWMVGYEALGIGVRLFDCSRLRNVTVPERKNRECFFIDIFFQKRYYKVQKKSSYDPTKRPSPDALANSWASFVTSMRSTPDDWMEKFHELEHDFITYNIEGFKMEIHRKLIAERVRCCLRREHKCPMCYSDSARASGTTRSGKNGRISADLHAMIVAFERRWREHLHDQALMDRLAEETEETYLAQVDQAWIEQQMRDVNSEVFQVYRMNLSLRKRMKEVETRDHETQDVVAEMKGELSDL